ncbi:MAG: hypothetical protein IJA20_09770 [Methanocorpusculum sp.]|nr:hypothetical protein [Oscillospiraceae bacterium]MBQ3570943.1 hypothetical protein [Methanocorpusculum sp.]
MHMVHVGKGVYINIDEIAYCCPPLAAPTDVALRAIDLSGGSKRCMVVLNSKISILIDITVETFLKRIKKAQGGMAK